MNKIARRDIIRLQNRGWRGAYLRLTGIYGEKPPVECWSRLAAEEAALQRTEAMQAIMVLKKISLEAMIHNSVMTVAGAINSSYAAWLYGVTQVNPLRPHYYCAQCGRVEFVSDVADGFDLPHKTCLCGNTYQRDGHDLPFEDYACVARMGNSVDIHVSESFKPIAVSVIKNHYQDLSAILPIQVHNNDGSLASEKYVVVYDRTDVPPVAEDGFWHTEAEEYLNWLNQELVFTIVVSEKLNKLQQLQSETQLDLPNLNTLLTPRMAQEIFRKQKQTIPYTPKEINFATLLKLYGLGHDAGTWEGNGDRLVREGIADLKSLPVYREEIWSDITKALRKNAVYEYCLALQVMEQARKGLYYSQGMPQRVEQMLLELGLPSWYPEYLKKIRYLWPKGHCVSDLIVDLTEEWYKQMVA